MTARLGASPRFKYPFRVKNHKTIRVVRDLKAEDWCPVVKLSGLVKELVLEYVPFSTQAKVGSGRPKRPLLPALRRLALGWPHKSASEYLSPFVAALVPETLAHLEISYMYHDSGSFFSHVISQCRSITHLWISEILTYGDSKLEEQYILDIIEELRRCPRLTQVYVTLAMDANRKVLKALSECPGLARLTIELACNDLAHGAGWEENAYPCGFSDLGDLELDGGPFAHATRIISSSKKKMSAIAITSDDPLESSRDLCDLTRAVRTHCDRASLQRFSVCRSVYTDEGMEWPLLFEHIAPLIAFRNLTELSLPAFDGTVLTDDDCTQMARAWPKLQIVDFTPQGIPWPEMDPACTWEGLAAFAQYCPDLDSVALPFDASSVPSWDPETPAAMRTSSITIYVHNYADIKDASDVARFFKRIFPLKALKVKFPRGTGVDPSIEENPERLRRYASWSHVRELTAET
ncbi:hypothetical protein EV715DRAFT_286032 [Schizophyllum commune]